MTVIIRVDGDPQPKGSVTAFVRGNRAVTVQGGSSNKSRKAYAAWAHAVASQAGAQYDGPLLDGPLHLTVTFWLCRPKTVKRARPHVPPDTDKLARAVLDPLTGIVWHDDSQVCDLHAQKFYAHEAQAPGCVIVVSTIDEEHT